MRIQAMLWFLGLVLGMVGCGETEPAAVEQSGDTTEGAAAQVVEPASGSTQVVTVTEGTNLALAVNPAGDTLAISVQGVLHVLPISGGPATAITDYYQDAREPAWSPDGDSIVYQGYANGNWDIWRLAAAGGAPEALTDDAFDDREPQLTPDAGRLIFSSDRSGSYDIWMKDLASGELARLTEAPGNEHSPSVSPDGQRLAYAAGLTRAQYELHVMPLSGGEAEVVASEAGSIAGVSWRSDGKAISYQLLTRNANGQPRTAMQVVDLDAGSVTSLSTAGADVFPFRAAWLDAETALFAADGRIQRWHTGMLQAVPFSVDFTLERPDYPRRQRQHDDAAPHQALGLVSPAISPDGQRVAFTALGDLWLWEPASSTLDNLTDNPAAEQTPAWSHDGGRLSYISDRGGSPQLWIYDVAGDNHEPVSVAAAGVSYPSWSPDGAEIALFAQIPNNPLAAQLVVVSLESGESTPVHRPVPAQPISWSLDGRHVATTALAPYSSRYREGVYQLEVADRQSGDVASIVPSAHRNILDAVLTPSGNEMTYVQGATLFRLALDEEFGAAGAPEPLTSELTDNPSWSAGGDYLVYMSGDRMKRLHLPSGAVDDITPSLQWRREQPDERWVLRVGRLFDGIQDGYRDNVDLHIHGNRIAAIEPAGDTGELKVVDATDKTVIPGLFEMHAHMGATSGSQGAVWLGYGITSVRDPGSNPYQARARQEAWDSGRRAGPRTYITGYLADGNRVYYSVAEGMISDEHLELALSRARVLQLDFIKTYVRLPDHWQARVVEFAHGMGIPVSSHELFPAVAHGADHVEHIGGTSRRGYQPKVSALGYSYGDVVNLISESGMGMTATAVLPGFSVIAMEEPDYFETPQFQGFYPPGAREGYLAMASRFGGGAGAIAAANGRLLRALTESDALLVTGTDAPFVPYGAGLHAELRLYARAGVSPYEILRSASAKSALAAGVADDLGTLEVGKLADLVVIDGDPLKDIRDADNVVMTVKNGRAYPLDDLLP